MPWDLIAAVIALALVIAAMLALIFGRLGQSKRIMPAYYYEEDTTAEPVQAAPPQYYAKTPLTQPEQILFMRLTEAFPDKITLAQVAMPALLGIEQSKNDWYSHFNRIRGKYVDFVVCRANFSVECVIELDDNSHKRYDRIESDNLKNVAFRTAGLPLFRCNVKSIPTVEQLRQWLDNTAEK